MYVEDFLMWEREKERGERKEAETRGGNECLAVDTHQHSPEEIKLPPVWLEFSAICIDEFESVSQTPSYFTGVRKEGLQSISETQSLPLLGMTGKSLWRSRSCRSTARGAFCSPVQPGRGGSWA